MAVTTSTEQKIQRLILLIKQKIDIDSVYLFGSAAKGATHQWSDIDLAIVSPEFTGDSFEDARSLMPLILEVDTAIEIHTFRPSDFKRDNPFVKEILMTGIKVY